MISSRHVEITRQAVAWQQRWIITDLQSTNGLFVRVSRTVLADRTAVADGEQPDEMDANAADEQDSESEPPDGGDDDGEKEPVKSSVKQRSPRERGKPIDLLKQLNLNQPGTVGEWRLEKGRLVFPRG